MVIMTLSTQLNDRTIPSPMDRLRGLLRDEHIHSNLVGPVFERRVDHLERRTGGPRPLMEMLSSISLG